MRRKDVSTVHSKKGDPMQLPEGVSVRDLNLSSLTTLPKGTHVARMHCWFKEWSAIIVPISDAQRQELADDGLLVLPLLDFVPFHHELGAGVVLFGVNHAEAGA